MCDEGGPCTPAQMDLRLPVLSHCYHLPSRLQTVMPVELQSAVQQGPPHAGAAMLQAVAFSLLLQCWTFSVASRLCRHAHPNVITVMIQ